MDQEGAPQLSKEERKKQRWERIQKRRAAKNPALAQAEEVQDDSKISAAAKAQIKKSRDIVDKTKYSAFQKASDIVRESDLRETSRRGQHEGEQEKRVHSLRRELDSSIETQEAVNDAWAKIAEAPIPQDIHKGILEQKTVCQQQLSRKDVMKREFEKAFKLKGEEYVMLLKKQETNIGNILWKMHNEFKALKEEYETQLVEIETGFMAERRAIMEKNRKDAEALLAKRRAQELAILTDKVDRDSKFHGSLDSVRQEDTESYNKLKMNLESHIQLLEQQLEEMRAVYQLNTEKLNYNFQVLKEREKENLLTVDHQKRREKRIKEGLIALKAKYQQMDKRFKAENKELSEEYGRVTKQYEELQHKFKHFQRVDLRKYNDIWAMNEEDVKRVLERLLKADRVIETQILGHAYAQRLDLSALLGLSDAAGQLSPTGKGPQSVAPSSMPAAAGHSEEQINQMLGVLVAECEFLVHHKVQAGLAKVPRDLHMLYKADSILKALGIVDQEDFEDLLGIFFVGGHMIDQAKFMRELRKYVVQRQHTQKSSEGGSLGATDKGDRRGRRGEQHWQHLAKVIPDGKNNAWLALERALKKYAKMLKSRKKMMSESGVLQEQNEQLKELLKGYLSSDINHDLVVPPTATMQLGPEQ